MIFQLGVNSFALPWRIFWLGLASLLVLSPELSFLTPRDAPQDFPRRPRRLLKRCQRVPKASPKAPQGVPKGSPNRSQGLLTSQGSPKGSPRPPMVTRRGPKRLLREPLRRPMGMRPPQGDHINETTLKETTLRTTLTRPRKGDHTNDNEIVLGRRHAEETTRTTA